MYVFIKKKFIDVENTNDPINVFALNSGWPDDINGKVFKQNAEILGAELIELHKSVPTPFVAKYVWCLTTVFIASVFVEHKIAIKLMEEQEWDELRVIFDDAGLIWSSGNKCTDHTPTLLKSRLLSEDKTDPISVHSSIYYGDRKLAVDVLSCLPGEFKVMSYSEFIDYCYEKYKTNYFVLARGCGKGLRVATAVIDELADGKAIEPVGFKGGKRPPIFSEDSKSAGLKMTSFEEVRKSIHQSLVDGVMNQPYDIHISSDGQITTAKFYVNGKVVREAEAKCHPEDRFNFHTGAEVAFNRLWEKKPKEQKSDEEKPKLDMFDLHVGDKVRVRKDLVVGERYNYGRSVESFVEMMGDLRGEVVTINQVFHREDGSTEYKILEHELWWTPQMFEEV